MISRGSGRFGAQFMAAGSSARNQCHSQRVGETALRHGRIQRWMPLISRISSEGSDVPKGEVYERSRKSRAWLDKKHPCGIQRDRSPLLSSPCLWRSWSQRYHKIPFSPVWISTSPSFAKIARYVSEIQRIYREVLQVINSRIFAFSDLWN